MTIEQLALLEKYYFQDSELSADDFEYVLANIPRSAQSVFFHSRLFRKRDIFYDIRDYYVVRTNCDDISSEIYTFLFSARYRCIKYASKENGKVEYIDFSKELFNPQGDTISHKVKVGKYQFFFENPAQYNFLIILLKWSDIQYENKKFPIIRRIDAQPLFISNDIQRKYGIVVDTESNVPFAVGFGELTVLDRYFVRPISVIKGGFFFYTHHYKNGCVSIEELLKARYIDRPTPKVGVFPSPCDKKYGRSSYCESIYSFRQYKDFKILGKEDNLLLYIIADDIEDYCFELRLFSKKDYYSVAAWLIVTLSYYNCSMDDKYLKIREFWPTCPILAEEFSGYKYL